MIGENVLFNNNTPLYMHNEEIFELGDNSEITDCELSFKENSEIHVGNNVKIRNCIMDVRENAKLILRNSVITYSYSNSFQRLVVDSRGKVDIGEATTIRQGFDIVCPPDTEIIIGKDCMISWDLHMLSDDCHTIFDIVSKQAINILNEGLKRRIILENHVWIGLDCTILYDTYIGEGSIVAAGSLLKGVHPNNCILAGRVAEIVKKDVAWCRENAEKNIAACVDYVKLTETFLN